MTRQQLIVDTKTPGACVGAVGTPYIVSYTPSSGGGWAKKGDNINGEEKSEQSGHSVSLSSDGNVVAIGAPYVRTGRVRVYAWNGTAWEKRGGDMGGEGHYDITGWSISLSNDGSIVAIGAMYNDAHTYVNNNLGHVRVYQYDATKTTGDPDQSSPDFGPVGWRRLGADIDGEGAGDESGYSVSLSDDGTVVAIGAIKADGYGLLLDHHQTGHVRVYQYDATKTTAQPSQSSPDFGPVGWRRLGADIDGEAKVDRSGWSVSLSSDGSIVAIGSIRNNNAGGHVRVYQYDATKTTAETNQTLPTFGPVGWNRLGADIDGEADYDYSGYSVSLSSDGSIVAIGARDNDGTGTDAGHVRVYKYDATKTEAQPDQALANFGPIGWNRLGADIDGEPIINDFSGRSVSLSSDGSIVAIGATHNDGGGGDAGHVRVYEYKTITEDEYDKGNTDDTVGVVGVPIIIDGGVLWGASTKFWVQQGDDIDGEADNDLSGRSVSLNDDGRTVAIGAPYADSNGLTNNGEVRVYRIGSSISPQVGDWAVAEHKETDTGADLSTYTYRVTHVTDADTLVLKFVSSSELGGLSNSVYSYKYTPSAGQLDSGLAFSSDGTKVFFIDHDDIAGGSSYIRRYNLGTPWDITSSIVSSFGFLSSEKRVRDITFSPDGMKLYATDDLFDTIKEYTLSSPWDVQGSLNNNITGTLVAWNSWGLTFSPDGTKLYTTSENNGKWIICYSLTTPWDIDTAVLASQSLSVSSQDTYPRSIDFSSDGRDLYVLGGGNDTIYQYILTTPWDLSTASYSGYSLYVGSQDLGPVGMVIPPGRNELYMAGQVNGAVYRYTLPEAYPDLSPCDLCDGTGSPGDCPIAPHVIKRDLGGMFMMLLD